MSKLRKVEMRQVIQESDNATLLPNSNILLKQSVLLPLLPAYGDNIEFRNTDMECPAQRSAALTVNSENNRIDVVLPFTLN